MSQINTRFSKRRKLLAVRSNAQKVAQSLRRTLAPGQDVALRAVLDEQHPADLADAMFFLNEAEEKVVFNALDVAEAAEVLDEVDDTTEAHLVRGTPPERLADILEELPSDEGADIVGGLDAAAADRVLALTDAQTAQEIRSLLAYPQDTAGGIMSKGFVDVPETATQAETLARFRDKTDAEHIFYVYVVDTRRRPSGHGGPAQPAERGAANART